MSCCVISLDLNDFFNGHVSSHILMCQRLGHQNIKLNL